MFVVFEGIDGSGKTTISNQVAERLRENGLSVKHLRAGGKLASSVSEAIRTLARDSRNIDLVPRAEFLLYVAREVQLMDELLADARASHDVVIADRFLYTAEVLARFGRSLPAEFVRSVVTAATGDLAPELVVLVDVDPVLARARRKASKLLTKDVRPGSRKGLSGVGLQHRLRRGYLEVAAEGPERWVVLSNEALLEDSVAQVSGLIDRAVREGPRAALAHYHGQRTAKASARAALESPEHALDALLAWLHRRAEREPQVAAYVLSGLSGAPVDELRRALARRVPDVVLAGLSGLVDDVSWELRDQLLAGREGAVARSLGGQAALHSRAPALRERLLGAAPDEVLKSLTRLDDEASWQLRERFADSHASAVISSLSGLDGERAWSLRGAWLALHAARIGEDFELARLAAKCVQGVPGERAFQVRESAAPAAPLAALASLAGLECERSFDVRERYLPRAPKPVMETLRRLRAPRAWQLRRAVAHATKEAIDSIAGLSDTEAWELRESYADVWPSTVVKSLGPLADTRRGGELLRRQLALHPENISLLKHAAAVALSAHRDLSLED